MSTKTLYDGLTLKQKTFADEYIRNGCNGTQAGLVAFDTDNIDSCAVMSSNLLRNIKVRKYIEKNLPAILITLKVDKAHRIKRLAEIFHKSEDRSSVSASRELNKMLGEYAPTKVQNMTPSEAIATVLEEQD